MGGLPTSTVQGFAVHPSNPRVMYVALRDGIFRSDNAGQSWHRVDGPANAAAVSVNPMRPGEVYAATSEGRIFVSWDGGVRWDAQR